MKYLVSSLIALPLITSCVVQQEYYEPGYYDAPPPPQVEVYRHGRHVRYYRPAEQARVHHGHAPRGSAVIVTPRGPRAQVEVHNGHRNLVRNSHHAETQVQVQKQHGHEGTVVTRSRTETDVQVRRKVETHANAQGNAVHHP